MQNTISWHVRNMVFWGSRINSFFDPQHWFLFKGSVHFIFIYIYAFGRTFVYSVIHFFPAMHQLSYTGTSGYFIFIIFLNNKNSLSFIFIFTVLYLTHTHNSCEFLFKCSMHLSSLLWIRYFDVRTLILCVSQVFFVYRKQQKSDFTTGML